MSTPSPAIPTFAADVMVTATTLNAAGSNLTNLYNYRMGGFRTLKPICAVRSTTGNIGSGSDTQIFWDTKDFDYDTMWSSSATGFLTVNTAGVYWIQIEGTLSLGPGGTNMATYIAINGTTFNTSSVGGVNVGSGNMLPCAALVGLSVGAHIYGGIFQSSGSLATISTANGGCRLTAEWVSP